MAIHSVKPTARGVSDPVFGPIGALPTSKFPAKEMRPDDACQLIEDELLLDGNARQNLATFVQTWEHENVHKLMNLSIDKNMIDKDEYPQTAELEARCVRMLADLWNAPADATPVGTSSIGSSEACMLGGMAMKWRWREKMKKLGKPTDKPNIVFGAVQVCWLKFARYWDIEVREVPMAHGRYEMGVPEMLARVDENTIGVVPTFGVTYTGAYELVKPLSDALDELQRTKGIDSTSTWTAPRAASSRPSARRTWFGISGYRGSSQSAARVTSSAWRPWAWAGWCGVTSWICPRI